jgi:sterol desaturase/sphingolipid hydroxylase (fatty acid hydroxylase superfamily)
MQRLVGLFIVLFALSAFFWLVERSYAAIPEQPPLYRRRGFWTDLAYWFTTPLLTRAVANVGLVILLMLIYREPAAGLRDMLTQRDTLLARQPLGLQAVEMLFLGDFIGYWTHRAFHRRGLWKFHAIHHSSTQLDWLSSVRVHPVNEWVTRWIQACVLMLLGFSPLAVAAYVPFLTFYAIFIHANVAWGFGRCGWLLASPRFHRWHHTSEREGLDRNFAGLFPVFDLLFRTYYMPAGRQPQRFGLAQERIPESFLGQLAYPFRRAQKAPATSP